MSKITVDVNVDDVLDQISDDELKHEVRARQLDIVSGSALEIITEIWQLGRTGKRYDHLVDQLVDKVLGKVV